MPHHCSVALPNFTFIARLIALIAVTFGVSSHAEGSGLYITPLPFFFTWNVSSGDWSSSANWASPALPSINEDVSISNGGTAVVTTSSFAKNLVLGFDPYTYGFRYGYLSVTEGSLRVSGSAVLGYYGIGSVTQSGGAVSVSNTLEIRNGSYSLTGGTLTSSEFSANGTFNQSGGIHTVNGTFSLDIFSKYLLSGDGRLTTGNAFVTETSNSAFVQTGGTNEIAGTLSLSSLFTPQEAAYVLNGGMLIVNSITSTPGTTTFSSTNGLSVAGLVLGGPKRTPSLFAFGGGTLQVTHATTFAIPMTLTGSGGNANLDTNGHVVALSGTLSGTGGLNKLGSGELTLSGTNAFTGSVAVKEGKLILSATESNVASLDVTTASGSELEIAGGTHTLDSVTGSGTTIVADSAVLTVGCLVQDTLILGGTLTNASNATTAVPEPAVSLIIGIAVLSWFVVAKRQK